MSARNRARDKRAKRNRKKDKPTGPEQKTDLASPTPTNGEQLKRLQQWLLPDGIFSGLSLHGNTKWTPAALVWLALCWAWSGPKNVTDAFAEAVKQCRVLGVAPVGASQGFMNALATWTDRLMRLLRPILHQRMQGIGGRFWRIGGWVPIAFDGSRSSAPRTRSNERAFCAANYGKCQTAKYRKKKSKGLRRKKNQKSKPQPPKPQA